mgnify:CR=1 FL=1
MAVLILGATSPIARALAGEYASAGHSVFVAARDVDEADRIAADLSIRHGVQASAGRFDALEMDDHADFLDTAEAIVGPIDVAVLAFGAMGEQEESQRDISLARKVIDTNYTGAVSICEALAASMSSRGSGSIIGISSVAGERGRKSNYIYGSAKGALTLYLGGLRNRLADEGVNVLTVKLGFVDTRMTFGMQTPLPIAAPEDAAKAIFAAESSGREILYYPKFWAPIMGIIRAIPERIFKKMSI